MLYAISTAAHVVLISDVVVVVDDDDGGGNDDDDRDHVDFDDQMTMKVTAMIIAMMQLLVSKTEIDANLKM